MWHRDVYEAACGWCRQARARPRQAHSYDMPNRLPALVDADGELVPATELPCAIEPDNWAASAPIETRRRSARICGVCPALASCDEMRVSLGDAGRGVLAGVVIPSPGQHHEARALSSSKT